VAFVDDDCTVEPRWVAALTEAFADGEVGLVQGRTRPAGDAGPNDRTLDNRSGNGLFESCNIAYRREVLEALGGFDESFGREFSRKPSLRSKNRLPLGEDTDLGWRVRRAGWRAAFANDAVVRHAVFPGRFADSVREEWRKRQFPYVVRRIPELRDALPRGRWFLRRQSPSAQLALLGGLLTIVGRSTGVRMIGPALAAPYVRWVLRREPSLGLAARQAVRDAVGSAALVAGSVQQRTLLL
jgi:GT2 family glycosyltransferase